MAPLGDDGLSDAEVARARAQVYDLFAAVFDGDVEMLSAALADDAFTRLGETLPASVDCDPLDRSYDTEALSFAYDNLFVVPGEHYVPPFASAHDTDPSESFDSPSAYHDVGTAGEFLGRPAASVSRLYAQVGFEPTRGDEIPDHVAAVLEFQAALCRTEAARREAGEDPSAALELQRSVYSSLAWLDEFDEAVAERDAETGLFAALSRLVRTFVAWDAVESDTAESASENAQETSTENAQETAGNDGDDHSRAARPHENTAHENTTRAPPTSTDDHRPSR